MNNNHIGNAGQHSVASMLERTGYTVGLLMSNEPNFDILIAAPETGNMYKIQVKSTTTKDRRWRMNSKAETNVSDDLFYICVKLGEDGHDDFYIVPSSFVANYVYTSHREWLNKPGRNGKPHKDNSIRIFELKDDTFLNRWDLLK